MIIWSYSRVLSPAKIPPLPSAGSICKRPGGRRRALPEACVAGRDGRRSPSIAPSQPLHVLPVGGEEPLELAAIEAEFVQAVSIRTVPVLRIPRDPAAGSGPAGVLERITRILLDTGPR